MPREINIKGDNTEIGFVNAFGCVGYPLTQLFFSVFVFGRNDRVENKVCALIG